jgi:hypothetical protein
MLIGPVRALAATLALATPAAASPFAWPVTVSGAGGTIVVSEPQVRSWANYTQLTGVAAVAVTPAGASTPVYGTLVFHSLASADVPAGTVALVNPAIDATTWPAATSAAQTQALVALVAANLHLEKTTTLPLAMVLASLPPDARPHTVPVRTNPPAIYVSQRPAVLVVFDGKPAFVPIAGTPLTAAANTNWDVIRDPASARYFVHARSGWYAASNAQGPYAPAVAPASFAAIPADGRWSRARAALNAPLPATPARVFVSIVPAALIDIAGPPAFANVPATDLRYVTNTHSDLFFSRSTTLWYALLAGRWFSAANLNGPWTFASTRLPADFKKIPADGPRGRVLVSVPGTTQAFYAAREAQVPTVRPLDPASATLAVSYASGAPSFAPIAGTPLHAAVNASTDVIQIDATHYFACDDGVWFAATSALGPWTLATYVPAVIYTIPPSSPLYHVTFVHLYDGRGVALTQAPATPEPRPQQTYQNFAPSQFSNGDRAAYANSYYSYSTIGYYNGYAPAWGGYAYGTGYSSPGYVGLNAYVLNPPTYGNYDDTTFARERAAPALQRVVPPPSYAMPAHGPRAVPGPGANVFAAADGIYRYANETWEKNAGGETWTAATSTPVTLNRDREARLAGYRGVVPSP